MARVTSDIILLNQARLDLSSRYGLDGEAFVVALRDNGGVISGSWVLEVVLGDVYSDSDLDVYCNPACYEALAEIVQFSNYRLTHSNKRYANTARMRAVSHVNTWERGNARIQFCIMHDMKRIDEHIARFDFTFLQNMFDGAKFHVFHVETLDRRGTALSLDSIARMRKYHERGFTITVTVDERVLEALSTLPQPDNKTAESSDDERHREMLRDLVQFSRDESEYVENASTEDTNAQNTNGESSSAAKAAAMLHVLTF